jgi:hypothetical protein
MEDKGLIPFESDWCLAPAAHLQGWMDEHNLTREVFAAMWGDGHPEAVTLVTDVLDRKPLGQEHADMLETVTGVPDGMWLGLERDYRAGLAKGLRDVTP